MYWAAHTDTYIHQHTECTMIQGHDNDDDDNNKFGIACEGVCGPSGWRQGRYYRELVQLIS